MCVKVKAAVKVELEEETKDFGWQGEEGSRPGSWRRPKAFDT
jgi:hypothetical protein